MADGEGFEPPNLFRLAAFETAALSHTRPPVRTIWRMREDLNFRIRKDHPVSSGAPSTSRPRIQNFLAGRERFELPESFGSVVFKTTALSRSATCPKSSWRRRRESNPDALADGRLSKPLRCRYATPPRKTEKPRTPAGCAAYIKPCSFPPAGSDPSYGRTR